MQNIDQLIDLYIAGWNEADAARRGELLARTYTPDGSYLDPLMQGSGLTGINQMIAQARAQFPSAVFQRSGTSETHHDAVRFSWDLVSGDGITLARGTDLGRLSNEGRFSSVVGFLDQMPG